MGENRNHLRLQHVKTIPERKTLVHPNPCHLYNTSSHFGANNFTFLESLHLVAWCLCAEI